MWWPMRSTFTSVSGTKCPQFGSILSCHQIIMSLPPPGPFPLLTHMRVLSHQRCVVCLRSQGGKEGEGGAVGGLSYMTFEQKGEGAKQVIKFAGKQYRFCGQRGWRGSKNSKIFVDVIYGIPPVGRVACRWRRPLCDLGGRERGRKRERERERESDDLVHT